MAKTYSVTELLDAKIQIALEKLNDATMISSQAYREASRLGRLPLGFVMNGDAVVDKHGYTRAFVTTKEAEDRIDSFSQKKEKDLPSNWQTLTALRYDPRTMMVQMHSDAGGQKFYLTQFLTQVLKVPVDQLEALRTDLRVYLEVPMGTE